MSRVDISGKAEQGGHGGTEKTNICCWENSLQETAWLHWGPQHRGPLSLHGDLGPDGVSGWVSLGGLSQLEQAPSGEYFKLFAYLNNIESKTDILPALLWGAWLLQSASTFSGLLQVGQQRGTGEGASIVWQNHNLKSHSFREYRYHRDAGTQPSWWTTIVQVILLIRGCFVQFFSSPIQVFTSAKTLLKIARVESGWILELIGVKKRIHWKYLNDCIKIWLFFCRPKCWTCKENLGWAPKGTIESVGGAQGRQRREGAVQRVFNFHWKVKVTSTLSLLLFFCYLCPCLKRACSRKYSQ